MRIEEVMNGERVDFSDIPRSYFLLGLLSAFENRFQAMADASMQEVSWKQFFVVICINLCKEPPTLKELSDILGSSHQNVKQILLKLEKKGFIRFRADETDRRKQRIELTEACRAFCEENDEKTRGIMEKLFEGLSEEELETTIRTIVRIEKNLAGLGE